jgi:hypothetical protein
LILRFIKSVKERLAVDREWTAAPGDGPSEAAMVRGIGILEGKEAVAGRVA